MRFVTTRSANFFFSKCEQNRALMYSHIHLKTTSPFTSIKNSFQTKMDGITNTQEKLKWRSLPTDFHTLVISQTTNPEMSPYKSLIFPIVNSTTFITDTPEAVINKSGDVKNERKYTYGLYGNPTRDNFENIMAKLDDVKHGLAFASGSAAASAIFQLLEPGDKVVAMRNIVGGSYSLLKDLPKRGVQVDFVEDGNVERIQSLVCKQTRMLFLESPTNPTLLLVDIEKVSSIVHEISKTCLVVVDNTFLTPILQRPLALGADVAMYSCSKFIGGHNDLIMGVVTTNSDELEEKLRNIQIRHGGVPSPFDLYLVTRSLKTLPLRMDQHAKNSLEVARFLENHPHVEKVLHPGLPSNPYHELALQQQYGHSGIMGFYIRGGYKEAALFLDTTKIVRRAASLGGDTTVGSIPSKMSHRSLTPEERSALGITDNFIRLSVGLEAASDIVADMDQALKVAVQ